MANKLKRQNLMDLAKSLEQAAKYASETAEPKDPDEVTPQEQCTNDVKAAEGENPKKPELKEGMTDATQPSGVDTKDGGTGLEESEQNVVAKAAAISDKLLSFANIEKQSKESAKKASSENVTDQITMSYDIMAKVAHVLTETEEGRKCLQKAIDSEKGKQIYLSTMNEIKYAAEQVQAFEQLKHAAAVEDAQHKQAILGCLSAIARLPKDEQKEQFKLASTYMKAMDIHQKSIDTLENPALKFAYAQGAQDAQMINDTGAPEEANALSEDLDAFGRALDELIANGEINQEQAQVLAQMAMQAAQMDGNPDLSPEEAQGFMEQAIQQGLLDPKVAEQIMMQLAMGAGQEAPMPPMPAGAPVPEQLPPEAMAAADQAVSEPVAKQASESVVKQASDRIKTAASKCIRKAYLKKVAEEQNKDVEISPEEVKEAVVEAVQAQEIDPDLAGQIIELIDTVSEDEPEEEKKEVEVDVNDDNDDNDDIDEKEIIEDSIKEASEISKTASTLLK